MKKKVVKCEVCHGTGWITVPMSEENPLPILNICPYCNGKGSWEEEIRDNDAK